jgi:hypothetical protein
MDQYQEGKQEVGMGVEDVAEKLASQLPIKDLYRDAAAPAAKQSGQLLADLVKCIQLALAPVQLTGALQDRFRDFLDTSVRRVPEQDRVSPAPQILGPILEGIRYEPEDTPVDRMFSHLLSNAMDRTRVSLAHPAYPHLIRQLASDEARLLQLLHSRAYRRVERHKLLHPELKFELEEREVDEFPWTELFFAENAEFYVSHLHQLGLASWFRIGDVPIGGSGPLQTGVRQTLELRLTNFGRSFADACLLPNSGN